MPTPEGKVKIAVKKALASYHVYLFADIASGKVAADKVQGFYYMPVAGPHSVLGIHDFVGCWQGIFWSIETKAEDAKEDGTHHQKMFQIAAKAAKGISLIGVRDASAVETLKLLVLEALHG